MAITWQYHGNTIPITWHGIAMLLPCACHVIAMLLPCYCHVIAMLLPFFCRAIAMLWPWQYVSSYSGLDLAWFGLASFGLVWFGLGWLWLLLRLLHRNLCGRSSSSHNSIHCKFRGFPDAAQSPLRHGCMHGATMLQLCRAIYAAVHSRRTIPL